MTITTIRQKLDDIETSFRNAVAERRTIMQQDPGPRQQVAFEDYANAVRQAVRELRTATDQAFDTEVTRAKEAVSAVRRAESRGADS